MGARVAERVVRLREPLRTAYGAVRERVLFELVMVDDDGVQGRGEAAPLPAYDGSSVEVVRAALDAYVEILRGEQRLPPTEEGGPVLLMDRCRQAADVPQALAAVELALWDRAGRREGAPVCALLADPVLEAVPVNATIGAEDAAGAAASAAAAAGDGYRCVKLKVGIGDDARRVAAVRAAVGPDVAIRLDANGAWTVEEAVAALGSLGPAGLEIVEEPVSGVAAFAELRERVAVRVAMDETAAQPGALAAGAADAVCLKVSRAGGISSLLAQAALVRSTGAEVYLASTLDGPLGIAAALHCAAALRCELPCGLATLALLDEEPPPGLAVRDGAIAVPPGPGLM